MLKSIENVLHVEVMRGSEAEPDGPFDLLVEVPHGADERKHYDALRARMKGALPDELHAFFHINTDVGAWDYGRATAEAVLRMEPTRSALLIRCLIPRTFVDCNRAPDFEGTDLDKGGLTAGIPAYVRDDDDRRLLLELHHAYSRAVLEAYGAVCGHGGVALVPHTYGPRSLGIPRVEDDIVDQLKWACAPERVDTWPLRAEVDLLTRDDKGHELSPPGAEAELLDAFARAGFDVRANDTYFLHPVTLAHRFSVAHPGKVLCLEVRRDLLVEEWTPFDEMRTRPEAAARIGDILAPAVARAMRGSAL